jgi:hypothetical protein
MRSVLSALAALAVLMASCTTPGPSRTETPAPSSAGTASPSPRAVLAKLPVPAKFGEQGIRVSPNGELLLVVEREGFVHTIYDLTGRALASHKLGEVAMNPFWLPDSSGVVTGRRVGVEPNGSPILDLSILELDGTERELVRRVSYPLEESLHVSLDRSSIAFATPCCPARLVVVARNGGAPREIATSSAKLRVLGWDSEGHVLHWSGANAVEAARGDGSRYRVPLGLPAGVNATDIRPGVRTVDGVASVFWITADGPFPGTAQNNVADRTLIARELRAYQSGGALTMRVSPQELLTYRAGSFGAYDITTGVTRALASIADDDGTLPTAMSGRIVLTSPARTWVRVFDLDRDDRWHETEVGMVLQTIGYALSRGRFLVFDEGGAPYVLDGPAARAAPARAALGSTSPNATVGTVREARNATVGRKMQLAWRMPDGAPQSLDYYAGSLVVVNFWTRACVICTQQLGLLSDVAIGKRLEIIAVGVDEPESSALEAAKDYRRLRPLVGSRADLKDIGVDVLPQTFILDSDHVVRQVIVGPLSWDALMRALTAASKSRLALRDRDAASG